MDAIDAKILTILQNDARTSNAAIARELDMAPSAILERIKKLQANGAIVGYEAKLDPQELGLGLLAFVFVDTDEVGSETSTGRSLAELPEVQEVHHICGEDCYLVKVRAESTDALSRVLREGIGNVERVKGTRTTIVLDTMKETGRLPVRLKDIGGDDD
jgi:Lrp/AsnC family leucine-responsive transcriptional regulator